MKNINDLKYIIVKYTDLANYLVCITKYLNIDDPSSLAFLIYDEITSNEYLTDDEKIFIIDIKEYNIKLLIKRMHKFRGENLEFFDNVKEVSFLDAWARNGNYCKNYPDYYVIEEYREKYEGLSYIKEKYNLDHIRIFTI